MKEKKNIAAKHGVKNTISITLTIELEFKFKIKKKNMK